MLDDVGQRLDFTLRKLETAVEEDDQRGIARCRRDVFTDPGYVRAGDEAHLRGQLDLPGARKPDPEQERLFHHLYGPAADLHRPQQATAS